MTKLQKNINLIKNLEKSYSIEVFLTLSDFISNIVDEIDKELSKINDKEPLRSDVTNAINRLVGLNIFLSHGGLNTLNIRYLNHIIKDMDSLAQQMYKHFDDGHISDWFDITVKGK